jgi:hypothetical protein
MGLAQGVHYHASRTVVNIKGVATDKTDDNGEMITERNADVTIGTAADPRTPLQLIFEEHFGRDREFEIKLTADERLAGATATTKGVGAAILQAGLSLVPLVAKVAAVVGVVESAPKTLDEEFREECPDLADRRQQLRQAIDKLQQAVADEATHYPPQPSDVTRLEWLQSALDLARAEAADIETRFNSWRTRRHPSRSRSLSYSIGVDDLPCRSRAELSISLDYARLGPVVQAAAEALGLVVVRIEDELQPKDPPQGNDRLLFRYPRPVQLAVYEVIDPASPQDLRLRSLAPASIIDSRSEWGDIVVRSGLFEEHGVGAEFGDEGTLLRVSNKDVGAAGTIASAVGGAGGQIKDAVEQGEAIAGAFAPSDPRLKSLVEQVTWDELQARDVKAKREIAGVTDGTA